MHWDVQLEVAAPVTTLFDTISAWHKHKTLLQLASVKKYRVLQSDGRTEYFCLEVSDLPFKLTYCYGKRLMRRPSVIVTIFTYRYRRSKTLIEPSELERLMETSWENFFYHTVRLSPLTTGRTRLRVTEPGSDPAEGTPLNDIQDFYTELGRFAEASARQPLPEDDGGVEDEFVFEPAPEDDYDPYSILGIRPDATSQTVKRAFRSLAIKWHPDKLASRSAAAKEYAHSKFIEVAAAYHTILRARGL